MAKTATPKKQEKQLLVEFKRHIALPIRRAPGQRVWLTPSQIKAQKLRKGDFRVVSR